MKTILRSQELSCPSCVAKIEKALTGVAGVGNATVHFNTGRIEVEHQPGVEPDQLLQAIRGAGYDAKVSPF